MNITLRVGIVTCAAILFSLVSTAQTQTNSALLKQASVLQAQKEKALQQKLVVLAKQKGWPLVMKKAGGGIAILSGLDDFGNPTYTGSDNNIVAAATIGTNKLWPGGSTGLNLSGASANVTGKLAIWDEGAVRPTHVELTGRVLQKDPNAQSLSDHSTHVAGTMIASGVNPLAKGMSFGQHQLIAYGFDNFLSEMFFEAPGLLVSNHSYGTVSGWNFNPQGTGTADDRWEFWGQVGATEDVNLGYYSLDTQIIDSISYNAPYYLVVKSAGNKRDENGPAIGQTYWRRDASNNFINAGPRPADISNNDGYDIIPTYGTAKNSLVVGAVNPLAGGYTRPEDVILSGFSSWGPTDDGRIKPDIVADGVNLLSSVSTNDNAYGTLSGTSMSAPNTSGSLLLLQEYYSQLHGGGDNFMRSATLKGIVIHTANECGPSPGPDYQFGWGLVNMEKAAAVITNNASGKSIIQENVLNNGGSLTLPVVASGDGKISATISWTDPKGSVTPIASALNNTASKLIDDLDIVIKKGATIYHPWILDPVNRSAAATTGDNILDNVEKVELPDVVPGDTYTIQVTHKGTLERGTQAYSLIVTGVGGTAYCTSGPTSNTGARIDSVAFGGIQNKNVAGCTTYSSFTSLTGNVEPGQSVPLFIRLNSCDATNVDKIVKVFIDANNDGDFTDADETVATSGVINGNGDFTTNAVFPSSLIAGKYAIVRIVMVETNTAANVLPCGSYTRGETQDYKILINTPSTDVGITELISPNTTTCNNDQQFVTVRLANFATAAKSNIPVTVVIKQGATTVATLTGNYPGTVAPNSSVEYTLQTSFNAAANTDYTFTSSTSLAGDQTISNNQNITTVTIKTNSVDPTGQASICNGSTLLKVTSTAGSDIYTWYSALNATVPIANGATTSTSVVASPYYVARNDVHQHIGPANKLAFPSGSYLQFDNNQQLRAIFTTTGPVTIETARLYIGQPGTITFRLAKINSFDFLTGAPDGFFVGDFPVTAYATAPVTPTPSTPNNDPADLGAIYRLNISVPSAGTWAIVVGSTGTASIFRNDNITTTNYPYVMPGVLSLDANGAVNNVSPTFFQGFYYFLYDIVVKLPNCPSNRVAVVPTTAVAPVVTLTGNVLTSNIATGNQWYKDAVLLTGETNTTYTAVASGTYKDIVTDGTGCSLTSNEIVFSLTAVPNVDPSEIGLTVSPIPSRGQFDMKLLTNTKADLDISLVSTTGQQLYHFAVPKQIGSFSKTIDVKVAAGVYYLRIVHDKKMYIRKIVII